MARFLLRELRSGLCLAGFPEVGCLDALACLLDESGTTQQVVVTDARHPVTGKGPGLSGPPLPAIERDYLTSRTRRTALCSPLSNETR